MIHFPKQVQTALCALNTAGYEAYAVGGCVRDRLMGNEPKDYDVTTSARPGQIQQVFADRKTIETGIKHGTVTVLVEDMPLEITTFRVDGSYSDGRHPDAVQFTGDLREDAARRDFTVNAMACDVEGKIYDFFGGREDLNQKMIRTVGRAEIRFAEDALRILRALRFASVLGFSIDAETAGAIHEQRELLKQVSAERLQQEFIKLLCGQNAERILMEYPDVLGVIIPEILPMVGFEQHNYHHIYDIWQHTVKAVVNIPPVPVLRLAALLHDVGKPGCFSLADDGVGHFYGHAGRSEELAEGILTRLKFDNETKKRVLLLVRRHDTVIEPESGIIKKTLNRIGEEAFFELMLLKRADTLAQAPQYHARNEIHAKIEAMAREILTQQQCFSLKNLAVNGNDLIQNGCTSGPQVGKQLAFLLDAVINEKAPNEKRALLEYLNCYKASL